MQQLPVVVAAMTAGLRRTPTPVLADAGYWSEANVELLERKSVRTIRLY